MVNDSNVMYEMLEENETILWQGKPKLSAFFWNRFFQTLPFVIIWGGIDVLIFSLVWSTGDIGVRIFICCFMALHALPVWLWLKNVFTTKIVFDNTYYFVTDKRVLLRDGCIGYEYKNIYYQNIKDLHLSVGLIDRMLGVGDIHIHVHDEANGKGKHTIIDIENPEHVFALLQRATRDIATDICYPNALRPGTNPGYHTSYR